MQRSVTYSRRLVATLAATRVKFQAFAAGYGVVLQRKAELAPFFAQAWDQYRRETRRSFVAFVQALVPDLPLAGRAYMHDARYQSALYLLRKATAPETVYAQENRKSDMTPLDLLAVTTKTLFVLTHPHEEALMRQLAKRSGWHRRDLNRLLAKARAAQLLVLPDYPRLVKRRPTLEVTRAIREVAADAASSAA